MSEPTRRAVFLSYAHEDMVLVRRIADVLREAGVEVWFDQNDLRGGEAWDRDIRRQIKECALFLPVISANTQSRPEGYFRLEWKLAVERSHFMADGLPFIAPVVIDDTAEANALVPEPFLRVQWIRLAEGRATPALAAQIVRLLSRSRAVLGPAPNVSPAEAVRRTVESVAPGRRVAVLRFAAVAAVALLAVAIGWWTARNQSGRTNRSIAVLPFANLSGEPKHDYLCEGLSGEIGSAIAGSGRIDVVARSSAHAVMGGNRDVRDIARKLGVQYVLEGRVHAVAQNELRVTAELVKADGGFRVWSKSLATDVQAIQREIIGALRRELLTEDKAEPASSGPAASVPPEAYDHYLRGRHAYGTWTEESLDRAISELNSALTLDPDFGLAWALLGDAMITKDDLFRRRAGPVRPDVYPAVLATAERAKSAARPARGEAHALCAHVFIHQLKFREAELESLQAVALSPGSSNAHQWYGHVFWLKGRLVEARREMDRAIRLEVNMHQRASLWLHTLRTFLVYTGQPEEGDKIVRQLEALGDDRAAPLHQRIIMSVQRRRFAEARELVRATATGAGAAPPETGLADSRWLSSYIEASAGNVAEARRLVAGAPHDAGPVLMKVLAYLAMRDRDAALGTIEGARDEDILGVFYQRGLPEYGQLASHPRWRALLVKVGLN